MFGFMFRFSAASTVWFTADKSTETLLIPDVSRNARSDQNL